jgi:hypothetical protein
LPSICRGWTVTTTPSARLDPRAILPLVQAERAIRRACPAIQEQLADEMREDYSRPILGE